MRQRSRASVAADSSAGGQDVQGAMLEPSVANTPWARALGVAAATAAAAYSTTMVPSQGAAFLHLVTYAIWLVSPPMCWWSGHEVTSVAVGGSTRTMRCLACSS